MNSFSTRQTLPMGESVVPWRGQNWREPRAKCLRLILQCDNGITVPLVVASGHRNPSDSDERLLVPDTRCGFGVLSFPKQYNAGDHRRASSTPGVDRLLSSSWERAKADASNVITSANRAMTSKYGNHPTPGIHRDSDKKEYCTYWIHKGECDFVQQGCRYKHEMPDLQTLQRIGFRDFPLWWKQRMFRHPIRPQNETLKKILAQESDSDSCSSEDADSEASSPITAEPSPNITTPNKRDLVCTSHVATLPPSPEPSMNLIDFEPVKPQQIERKPINTNSRTLRFIPYNELQDPTPPSSHTTPPVRLDSPFTPAPTVPHPTPATSPEQKHSKPSINKDKTTGLGFGKFPAPNIADSEPPAAATAAIAAAQTAEKAIKPEDLQRQIENLQAELRRQKFDVKQAAPASRGVTPVPTMKAKKTGVEHSKYAKSSESEDGKTASGLREEKEKRKRSKRAKKAMKVTEQPMVPVYQSVGYKPRRAVNGAAITEASEVKDVQVKSSGVNLP